MKEARNELARCNCCFCNRSVFLAYHTGVLQMNMERTEQVKQAIAIDVDELVKESANLKFKDVRLEEIVKRKEMIIDIRKKLKSLNERIVELYDTYTIDLQKIVDEKKEVGESK